MSWLFVALGGACGASLRYFIALQFSPLTTKFPWGTFLANSLGCFFMGLGFLLIVEKALVPELWRHFLLVGLLGALTTFSTFSIEVLSLIQIHAWKYALVYVFASVFVSILSAALGLSVAKTIFS